MGVSTERADLQGTERPALGELVATFFQIGILSFGGPAAQIALMHRLLVEEKGWLSEKQYLNALSFCMLLPGPEAMQLATYAGWRLHGLTGGVIAGLLFVLPGAFIIAILAGLYSVFGNLPLVDALFLGIKAAVLVIVVEALLRVARRALQGPVHWLIAALAFIGIFFLALPYPLIVVLAALFGYLRASNVPVNDTKLAVKGPPLSRTATTVAIGLAVWWVPVAAVAVFSAEPILTDIAIFFSKLAVVTFGGAYAVLAYMAQDVVSQFGWLTAGEMMDGLGLAETTPGPLILVTQFVGFIAAFREGGLGLGFAGAAMTLWVTFIPCFLWIFAGAPYIDWIAGQPRLTGALSAITAAVVGVILNLSLWFGLHVLFGEVTLRTYGPLSLWQPDPASIDWRVVLLSAACGFFIFRARWSIVAVLAASATGGLGLSILV